MKKFIKENKGLESGEIRKIKKQQKMNIDNLQEFGYVTNDSGYVTNETTDKIKERN